VYINHWSICYAAQRVSYFIVNRPQLTHCVCVCSGGGLTGWRRGNVRYMMDGCLERFDSTLADLSVEATEIVFNPQPANMSYHGIIASKICCEMHRICSAFNVLGVIISVMIRICLGWQSCWIVVLSQTGCQLYSFVKIYQPLVYFNKWIKTIIYKRIPAIVCNFMLQPRRTIYIYDVCSLVPVGIQTLNKPICLFYNVK